MDDKTNEVPKVGDVVIAMVGRKWVRAVVERAVAAKDYQRWQIIGTVTSEDDAVLELRPEGRTRGGSKFGCVVRPARDVRPTGDCVTAHVFADFLEENGEPTAAAKLRAAFPLC